VLSGRRGGDQRQQGCLRPLGVARDGRSGSLRTAGAAVGRHRRDAPGSAAAAARARSGARARPAQHPVAPCKITCTHSGALIATRWATLRRLQEQTMRRLLTAEAELATGVLAPGWPRADQRNAVDTSNGTP